MTILTSELGGSGGGGGVPVGTVLPIRSSDGVYVAPDGSTWLQSGTVETTEGTYPDADYSLKSFTGTGDSFDIVTETSPQGIFWDGVNFWVTGNQYNIIWKYDSDGNYLNFNINASSYATSSHGVAGDGTYLYLLCLATDKVYKYTTSGSYQTSFAISSGIIGTGIVYVNGYLYISDSSADVVQKYTTSGSYEGVAFDVSGQTPTSSGIAWDGSHFWISNSDTVFKYTSAGVYTGISGYVTEDISDITFVGNVLWGLNNTTDDATGYSKILGYGIDSATDTDSGLPLYVKVA